MSMKEVASVRVEKTVAQLFQKSKSKSAAIMSSSMAFILSACGGSSSTTSSTLLTLTKSADTYSATSVTGFSLNASDTAKFDVADASSNAYEIKLDATGTGVIEFDFADANDTVTLQAGSKTSGFTTLKVTDGTLDATNADLTGITRVEVASGIKISLAQIKSIPTVVANSATSEITVEVATEAEATELVSLISAGTVKVFGDSNPIKLVAAPAATVATETLTAKQTETTASVKPKAEAPADTSTGTDTGTTTPTTPSTPTTVVVVEEEKFSLKDDGAGNYTVGRENGNVTVTESAGQYIVTPTKGDAVGVAKDGVTSFKVDVISMTAAADVVTGETISGSGNVSITAADGDQTIALTTTGTNTIDVGAGADTVTASTGTNTITTGTGADTVNLTTTTGTQTVKVTSENGVTNLINATGAGATYAVQIAGTTSGTVVDASGSSKTISFTGSTGNDTFEGGTGADAFAGGTGNDTYVFDGTAQVASGESITEAASAGTDRVKITDTTNFANMTAASFDEIDEVEIVGAKTATFTGAQLTGETMSLIGGTGIQAIVVGATGGGATDLSGLSAGTGWTAGTDTITIGGADATAEVIVGTATNDTIDAADGNDTVTGGGGADAISVGAGNDTVIIKSVVGTSSDSVTVAGSGANDDTGADTVSEFTFGSGTDVIKIVATNVDGFAHGTDTDIGAGTGTDTAGTNAAYTTSTGLIDLNQATNKYTDAGDIVVTFSVANGDTFNATKFKAKLAYDLTADADGTSGITGGGLADTLTGGAGADTLTGGAGDDVIQGGAGADTLDGGNDTDTVSFADITSATAHSLTNVAGVAVNLTSGTVAAATISTAMGGTKVIGGGDGSAGADLATMNAGYLAATAAGSTTTMVRDGVANFENVVGSSLSDYIALGATDAANGGAGNDYIIGGTGVNNLTGGAGDDTIIGGAGADVINGGDGTADVVSYADIAASSDQHSIGDAALIGVVVNLSASAVTAAAIDAALTAGTYTTASDADIAAGKAGYISTANNTSNADVLDTITNVEGVVGSARSDYIALGAGGMTADGGAGVDFIVGGTGADTIVGGAGADIITGGAGLDTLTGGDGADVFVLDQVAASASIDTIKDFVKNTDKINVNGALDTGDVTLVSSAFTTWSGSATATDNAIVNLASSAALADAAAVVAKFEASDSDAAKMVLGDGNQVILVVQDDDANLGTDYAAQIWNVDNTGGTLTATQIAIVEITASDSTSIVVGDFI